MNRHPSNPWPVILITLGVGFTTLLAMTITYGIRHRSRVVAEYRQARGPARSDQTQVADRTNLRMSTSYHREVLTLRLTDPGGSVRGARVEVALLDPRGLPGPSTPLVETAPGTYTTPLLVPSGGARARVRASKDDSSRTLSLYLAP